MILVSLFASGTTCVLFLQSSEGSPPAVTVPVPEVSSHRLGFVVEILHGEMICRAISANLELSFLFFFKSLTSVLLSEYSVNFK